MNSLYYKSKYFDLQPAATDNIHSLIKSVQWKNKKGETGHDNLILKNYLIVTKHFGVVIVMKNPGHMRKEQ